MMHGTVNLKFPVKLVSASCVNVLRLNCQFGLITLCLTHLSKRFSKRIGEEFIHFFSLHAKEMICTPHPILCG